MAKNKKKASAPATEATATEKEVPAYAAKNKEPEKKKDKKEKKHRGSAFVQFWKDLFSEGKKINWSKSAETFKNFLVVLLVILVIGICVWVCDALLVKLREVVYTYDPADAETAVILLRAQLGLL